MNKTELATLKRDFCFPDLFDQVAFERYFCSTLHHLQNLVEDNFHFLTQPQRRQVQGQSCVVFVPFPVVMATVIIGQPPWAQHLCQELFPLTESRCLSTGRKGRKRSPEELQEIVGLV